MRWFPGRAASALDGPGALAGFALDLPYALLDRSIPPGPLGLRLAAAILAALARSVVPPALVGGWLRRRSDADAAPGGGR